MSSINARDTSQIHLRRKIQAHSNISVKCDELKALTIVTDKQRMEIVKFEYLMNKLALDIQNNVLHDATIPLETIPSTTAQKKLREVQALLQEQIDFCKHFVEPNAIVHASKSKKRQWKKPHQGFNTVCRYFRDGKCKNGGWCRFRHTEVKTLKYEKYKQKMCRFWKKNGSCIHGEHCTFAHILF